MRETSFIRLTLAVHLGFICRFFLIVIFLEICWRIEALRYPIGTFFVKPTNLIISILLRPDKNPH